MFRFAHVCRKVFSKILNAGLMIYSRRRQRKIQAFIYNVYICKRVFRLTQNWNAHIMFKKKKTEAIKMYKFRSLPAHIAEMRSRMGCHCATRKVLIVFCRFSRFSRDFFSIGFNCLFYLLLFFIVLSIKFCRVRLLFFVWILKWLFWFLAENSRGIYLFIKKGKYTGTVLIGCVPTSS